MKKETHTNLVGVKDRFLRAIAYLKGNMIIKYDKDIVETLEVYKSNFSKAKKGDPEYLTESFVKKFCDQYGFNKEWLWDDKGEMMNNSSENDFDQNSYVIEFFKELDISQNQISEDLGVSQPYVSALVNGKKDIGKKMAKKIASIYGADEARLLLDTGEMLTSETEDLEKHNTLVLAKGRKKKYLDEVIPVPESDYMMVEYVHLETSAGKLGVGDVETLPEHLKRLVPREYAKGSYLVVGISGDSMDDGTKRALSSGDEVLVKLYTDNIDFLPIRQKLFVINTLNGSVVKQITKIDKENQTITCHSFNPAFNDFEVPFDEIIQLFTVEKIVNSKIRF